jgi:transposase-like protein
MLTKRPVRIKFQDGTVEEFQSLSKAAERIDVEPTILSRWLRRQPKRNTRLKQYMQQFEISYI